MKRFLAVLSCLQYALIVTRTIVRTSVGFDNTLNAMMSICDEQSNQIADTL